MDIGTFEETVVLFNNVFKAQPDLGLRLSLINEELGEMCKELSRSKGDPVKAEQEWADLLFVVIGMGHAMGFRTEEAMQFVAEKNFKKIHNPTQMTIGPNGKVLKPEDS